MEDKDIFKKIENLEEKVLCKLGEWESVLNTLQNAKDRHTEILTDKVFYKKLIVPAISINLSSNLYATLMESNETYLPSELAELRSQLLDAKGYIIPNFEVVCNDSLPPNNFVIFIRNEIFYKGKIHLLNPDPIAYIIDQLTDIVFIYADKIITRDFVWNIIKMLEETDKTISEELTAKAISIGTLRQIFVNLLKERISIKDIRLIIQNILELHLENNSPDFISEKLREVLKDNIINEYIIEDKALYYVTLSDDLESTLINVINQNNAYQTDNLGKYIFEEFANFNFSIRELAELVILTKPALRIDLYRILAKHEPSITVLSVNEITENVKLKVIGTIDIIKCYDIGNINIIQETETDDLEMDLFDLFEENSDLDI
jgi:flagellar biosynthesis protein FlhA